MSFLILSCKKEEKTFYPDGTLQTIAQVKKSRFHGSFKAYRENGELEMEGVYKNGLMEGTFFYYLTSEDEFSKIELFFKKDTAFYQKYYDKSGNLIQEGFLKENHKIGRWLFYNRQGGYINEIQEIYYKNDVTHLNQTWKLNKRGDTIGGNYFKIKTTTPIMLKNQYVFFDISHLAYFEDSQFNIFIPDPQKGEFEEHFLNEDKISNNVISEFVKDSNGIKFYDDKNNIVKIHLHYTTAGKKNLRGFLLEKKKTNENDSIDLKTITRKIYFEKEIEIKDHLK